MDCSNKWKLDKIDKIFIATVLIIITIFCFLNTFVFAVENLEPTRVSDLTVVNNSYYGQGSRGGFVFSLKLGHQYRIHNASTGYNHTLRMSPEYPSPGVYLSGSVTVEPNSYVEIEVTSENKYLFATDFVEGLVISIEDITDTSFSGINKILARVVSPFFMWNIFETAVPYIAIVVFFGLGVYFVSRITKGVSKGKGRI